MPEAWAYKELLWNLRYVAGSTYLKSIGWRARVVTSYENRMEGEPKFIASNRLDWDAKTKHRDVPETLED